MIPLTFEPTFELIKSDLLPDGMPFWMSDTQCFLSRNDYAKAEMAIETNDQEALFRLLLRLDTCEEDK